MWYYFNQIGTAFLLGLGAYHWMAWCVTLGSGTNNWIVTTIGAVSGVLGAWAGFTIYKAAYKEEVKRIW